MGFILPTFHCCDRSNRVSLPRHLTMVYTRVTHLAGSKLHPNPVAKLCQLYLFINRHLLKYPENCYYRRNTEMIIDYRRSVLQETQKPEEVECLIACGTLEQLILQAERELELSIKLLNYKPWEPLIAEPPELQWTWPVIQN